MGTPNFLRACFLTVPLILCGAGAAQAQPAATDTVKAAVAAQRAALTRADSAGDRKAAFEARMQLASLSGRAEGNALLKQAAALADSMDRPDLGAMARRVLATRMAQAGAFSTAYAEVLLADSLRAVSNGREASLAEDRQAEELRRLVAERDSLELAAGSRERGMAQAIAVLQQQSDNWMYSAIAALVTGLLLVIGLLYRMGRTSAKLRGAISELRAEVDTLKAKSVRPAPVAPAKPEAPSAVVAAEAAMEKVAGDKFRQDAPERLTTLQEARKRGDVDKALRVLATLKPQLLAYDAARFSPLITSLRVPNAPAHAAQWNADLDKLEAAIRELSAHHGGK